MTSADRRAATAAHCARIDQVLADNALWRAAFDRLCAVMEADDLPEAPMPGNAKSVEVYEREALEQAADERLRRAGLFAGAWEALWRGLT